MVQIWQIALQIVIVTSFSISFEFESIRKYLLLDEEGTGLYSNNDCNNYRKDLFFIDIKGLICSQQVDKKNGYWRALTRRFIWLVANPHLLCCEEPKKYCL